MSCKHDWTIYFPSADFEIRPITMNLKLARNKYDYARLKLPPEVGQMMKPHTRYDDGKLHGINRAEVRYNGETIKPLFFRPDFADYGTSSTHLELHDLHKSLVDGTVDIHRDPVQLKKIYSEVLNEVNHRLIPEIKWALSDTKTRTVYGKANTYKSSRYVSKLNQDETSTIADSWNGVDFDKVTPEVAIAKLNKKFNITSWINRDSELVVGRPENANVHHLAAPNDDRVWRYKDPQVSHGREPIKAIEVKGKWEDESGFDTDVSGWFDQGGTNEAIAYGYAERTDIDYGTRVTTEVDDAGKDSVAAVARQALRAKMREQNSGSVDIDPNLSGTEVSNAIDLQTGDILHLVPHDDYFENPSADSGVIGDPPTKDDNCNISGFVNNEAYIVTDVTHDITEDGDWNINAELGMYADVPIKTWMSYYDPKDDEVVSKEQMETGWLESGENDFSQVYAPWEHLDPLDIVTD